MVSACVTWKGATKPFFVNDKGLKVNSKTYKKHLEKERLPEVNRIMNNNILIFIQLGKRFIKHTEWPRSSPECNPLDYHFWNKIKERVYEDRFNQPFGNSNELKRKIKKVWPEVAHDLTEIRKPLKQFKPRLKAVEEKKDSQLKCYSDKLIDFVLLSIIMLFIIKLVH